METSTEAERDLLRRLFDAMPQLGWTAHPDGFIDYYNRGWYEYTGTTYEGMKGWGWKDVHHPDELPRVLESWKRSIAEGQPWELEFPLRRHDGVYRWFLSRATPVHDECGNLLRWVGINTDIDDQKHAERKLIELDHAKTTFFSSISHEFRTPLTLMLGPTEEALSSSERALKLPDLETVYRNELRLLKLVNSLLDFSRIEAGRLHASYRATDLAALTVDLTSVFRSAIERAGLALDVECPPLSEPIYVDHDMWEKIVLNLLSNALKFTFDGTICVSLRGRSHHVELIVSDTGVGIAASDIPRIFERFHRIEGSRSRTHEGSGIGLALVSELVRLHGGTIEVTSKSGVGTTFQVSIPRGTSHLPQAFVELGPATSSASFDRAYVEEALGWLPTRTNASSLPPRGSAPTAARILVADDNADMRRYLARILRDHWSVESVANGAEALALAQERPPDLIISDVMMPSLDGFALTRALKGDPRTATVPIILLSARMGEVEAAQGVHAGADDYVVKPFSAGALLVRVEAQLSAARLRAALRHAAETERRRLRTMFQASPAAICLFRGNDLTLDLVNPVALRLWGKDDSIIGQPALQALPELCAHGFADQLRSVLTTGIPHHGNEVPCSSGLPPSTQPQDTHPQERYFDFVSVPILGEDEKVDGVFFHAYDVTDKVVAHRHADALRESAERSVRAREDVLATVSHDLRNPLNTILLSAKQIEFYCGDEESLLRSKKAARRIIRAVDRMSGLVGDLFDLAKIDAGQSLPLDVARHDVSTLAREAAEQMEPVVTSRRLTLTTSLATQATAMCDGNRVQQVLANLLGNAVKFTPEGGRIHLGVQTTESEVQVSITDTGTGISLDHVEHIFEAYWQAESTHKSSGAGLGLSISKAIVTAHGGRIWVETCEGAGSCFRFTLPAIHATSPSEDTR